MKSALILSFAFFHYIICQPREIDSLTTIKKAFDSVDANKDGIITFE